MNKSATFTMAAILVLAAVPAFAHHVGNPEEICVKPEGSSGDEMARYQSCMAAYIDAQKADLDEHIQGIKKAEAAMEANAPRGNGSK